MNFFGRHKKFCFGLDTYYYIKNHMQVKDSKTMDSNKGKKNLFFFKFERIRLKNLIFNERWTL